MARFFEVTTQEQDREIVDIIDFDKVCKVRIIKSLGQGEVRVKVRFVDGHELSEALPGELAQRLENQFRQYMDQSPRR